VQRYVLDASLVRVKIWRRDGTIVYSDETRLIGTQYPLDSHHLEAIDSARARAEVSDPARTENRYERSQGKLLDVYLGVRTPEGHRLLFETYFRYGAVSAAGDRIWRRFVPVTLGALLALELVQIPLAWSLARRLRRRQIEPARLVDTGNVDNAFTDLLASANGRGIATTIDTDGLHDALPPAVVELLYRAAREALRNALTHTNATSVTVRVSDHQRVATLEVVDDGAVEPGRAEGEAEAGHVGLRALTDLIAIAGGRLVVDSANGAGTRVYVEVPLQ
jgi:hypothetical protein